MIDKISLLTAVFNNINKLLILGLDYGDLNELFYSIIAIVSAYKVVKMRLIVKVNVGCREMGVFTSYWSLATL